MKWTTIDLKYKTTLPKLDQIVWARRKGAKRWHLREFRRGFDKDGWDGCARPYKFIPVRDGDEWQPIQGPTPRPNPPRPRR